MPKDKAVDRFAGRNVVVTGGNSGIGLATARAFAQEGARVAIVGRDPRTLADAARTVGPGTVAVRADLGSLSEIERAKSEIVAAMGTVDVLFANAGTGGMIPFEQVDEPLWDAIFDLNVKGTYFTVQKCLPMMTAGAAIVLCSSVSAERSMPGASVYAASKAAVNSIGRSLGGELAGRGIRVNVVVPGGVDTPILRRTPGVPPEKADAVYGQMAAGTPMRRIGRPEEVAAAVLFLASSEASYVTAAAFHVDGGIVGAT